MDPDDSRRSWRRRPSRLTAYVGGTCVLGALAVAVCAAGVDVQAVGLWQLLLVAGLFVVADLPLLETRFGHNVESFTFVEVSLVVGLVLLPTPVLVVLTAACVLALHVLRRIALAKAAFNTAQLALGAGLAGLVLDLAGGLPRPAGLLLAVPVFFVWNGLTVSLAVALSQGLRLREVYVPGLLMRSLVCVGNTAVGICLVSLADWDPRTLVALPPLLVGLFLVYRGYLRAGDERDVWQQLESSARELNRLDEQEVATAAVVCASRLLKADWVELVLRDTDPDDPVTAYVGNADGLDLSRTGIVHGLGLGTTDGGRHMSYDRPLEGPEGVFGVLKVCFDGSVVLNRRELHVLRTFAYSVAVTMQNARLYSEMRAHATAMAYEATHDSLTGLGNRALLHARVDGAFGRSRRVGEQTALLIVDLDHFKEINDTLGHSAGDVFLREVAGRIRRALPEADAVCRLGGDEFAVLIGGLPSSQAADLLARDLLTVLAEPVQFDGLRLSIEGSVGVACYPQDASTFDELLQRADIALYQAKVSRGATSHYSSEHDASSVDRLSLAAELRTALRDDELVVHFQPQYDLVTGAIVSAEALVRWQHPRRGLLMPGEFIDAVEHSGLVRAFTLAVLDKAVSECASWAGVGRPIAIAVNLSARNLLDRQLPLDVADVLLAHGLDPQRLVLEITETTMMSELDVIESVLGQLRAMGVQLSVDDFGTGYSSLAFLQRVAVNEVKIDRSFVSGMLTSDNDAALVRATIQLAHSLGARAVAEGVESADLAASLGQLGCDLAQGYHFCRPVPADEIRALVLRAGMPSPRAELGLRRSKPVGEVTAQR